MGDHFLGGLNEVNMAAVTGIAKYLKADGKTKMLYPYRVTSILEADDGVTTLYVAVDMGDLKHRLFAAACSASAATCPIYALVAPQQTIKPPDRALRMRAFEGEMLGQASDFQRSLWFKCWINDVGPGKGCCRNTNTCDALTRHCC